jgi:pyruvate/2-oxoglutarate dehydrogenase complex dihydrolipoamide dehydrogenase (E3) component
LYADFGAKVTVLQDSGVFLPREDGDMADEVRKVLESKGISFVLELEAQVKAVEKGGDCPG